MRLHLFLAGLLALSVTAAASAQPPGPVGRGGFSPRHSGGMTGGAFAAGSPRSHGGLVSYSTFPFPPRSLPLRPGTFVSTSFPPFYGPGGFGAAGFSGGFFPGYGFGYAPGLGLGYGGYGGYWPGFYDSTPD